MSLTLGGQRYTSLLRYSYVTYADDEAWDRRPNVKKLAGAEDRVWHAVPTAVYTTSPAASAGARAFSAFCAARFD
jgi:hypothetical protein|eukprot:COSAG01_NODE_2212_length_8157_cov_20.177960_5_plen_75_part_00